MRAEEPLRLLRFVAVGCAAAVVHWACVVALVEGPGWPPLLANVAGWMVAFVVSFGGHHLLSFHGHGLSWATAARRFAAVSAGAFALNQAAYALLLHFSGQRYDLLLAAVLVAVALFTYALSRHWAFLRS
ncbi:MAG: GtrA family protein [Rubrivivax sp.]|nr:GtrA family protein [Rubrivivax sp.]